MATIAFAELILADEKFIFFPRLLRTLDPAIIKTEVEGLNEIADNFRPIQTKNGRVVRWNVMS